MRGGGGAMLTFTRKKSWDRYMNLFINGDYLCFEIVIVQMGKFQNRTPRKKRERNISSIGSKTNPTALPQTKFVFILRNGKNLAQSMFNGKFKNKRPHCTTQVDNARFILENYGIRVKEKQQIKLRYMF